MKKISTKTKTNAKSVAQPKAKTSGKNPVKAGQLTIGIDLGDKVCAYCVLDEDGEIEQQGKVPTNPEKLRKLLATFPACVIAMEAGTHSRWISQLLGELGHEVIVANPRRVRLITESDSKTDEVDAETLARLARADRRLLHPIQHRGAEAQTHLTIVRVRALLVKTRTMLINGARGLAKSFGERLPKASTESVTVELASLLSPELRAALQPLLTQVEVLNRQIREADAQMDRIAFEHYPEVKQLRQVHGVGPVIGLTYVLTIDSPERFRQSRSLGCYLGLRPKRSSSGQSDPQLPITKAGDMYLRTLLVNAAQTILRRDSPDSDLKRWGLKLAGTTKDQRLKKRAVVAVARKLSVLLHRLWVTGEEYEPLRNSHRAAQPAA